MVETSVGQFKLFDFEFVTFFLEIVRRIYVPNDGVDIFVD